MKSSEEDTPVTTASSASVPLAPTTTELPSQPKDVATADQKADGEGAPRDRDVALGHVLTEKRLSFVKAWEESEKTKALNKAQRKLSVLDSWEKNKKSSIDAKLKGIEEKLETKKAEQQQQQQQQHISLIPKLIRGRLIIIKEAEERRAMIEASKGETILTIEEKAAKYRATGSAPKKFCGCLSF